MRAGHQKTTGIELGICPQREILPGVRFGRPEWVPSPAYWLSLVSLRPDHDDFVSRGPIGEEVGFCLLGGYGVTAEMATAAHDRLKGAGVFKPDSIIGAAEIEALLRSPLRIAGRSVRYRFPQQRARRIASALERLRTDDPPEGARALRDYLVTIPGIGPKTASWVVRNLLGSDEVAIIDIHIQRAGLMMGLFSRDQVLPRDYAVMEESFLRFAEVLQVPASKLDAVMWSSMRRLGRGADLN